MTSKNFCFCAVLIALLSFIFVIPAESENIYSKWTNGPPKDGSFFLIGVFLQRMDKLQQYKDIGINTYVCIDGKTDSKALKAIKDAGMYCVAEGGDEEAWKNVKDKTIIAWRLPDEPDNFQFKFNFAKGKRFPDKGNYSGKDETSRLPPAQLKAMYDWIKKNDPTRPIHLTLGCGVTVDDTKNRGPGWNNDSYFEYCKAADIVGYDVYPIHSNRGAKEFLWLQAQGLDRLKKWSSDKPMWNFFECTHRNLVGPNPNELKCQIWMSIIHGSMGIQYFCHEFNPECDWAFLNYPDLTDMAKKVNGQINQLAPVLNSPSVEGKVQVSSSNEAVPIDMMVKEFNDKIYIFSCAMRMDRTNKTIATFTIPELLGKAAPVTVEVLGEPRTININNGRFEDRFRMWDSHVYSFSIAKK